MPASHLMKCRDRCPGCLSDALSLLYAEPYAGPGLRSYLQRHYEGRASRSADGCTYELLRCGRCGLVFQKYVPAEQLLDEVYNAWVPGTELERAHRDYSLEAYRYLAEQVQFVIQHFRRPPGELAVLDFGFGWGHWSRMAMAYGCDVSGVELSDERSRHGRSIGIRVLALDELPDRQFHFIHTEQVFEHLVEPRAVLERLVASLAVGGLVKISVPDAGPSLKKLAQRGEFGALSAGEQMPIAPLEHINAFTHESLVAFAATLGLKPLRPSFFQLYNSASGLLNPRNLARVITRPVYRHVFPRSTFVYFVRA